MNRSRPSVGPVRTRIDRATLLLLALLAMLPGCRSTPEITSPLEVEVAIPAEPGSPEQSVALQQALDGHLDALRSEFSELRRSGGWAQRGYFVASEHDAIEGLLFRFVVAQAVLWGEFDRWGGAEMLAVDSDDRPRVHVLVLNAGVSLAGSSSALVDEFKDDPVAIAKLNEAFYRSEIPGGTYDLLRRAVTSRDRRAALRKAWQLHEEDLRDPDSPTARLAAQDPRFASLLDSMSRRKTRALAHIDSVSPVDRTPLQEMGAALDNSNAADLGRSIGQGVGDAGYQTRALVFKDVSRIKSPTADLIRFSAEQKQLIHAALRPGDILLSYTAGYVSSVFIPGVFKHGMTFVGSPDQRAAAGLTSASIPAVAASRRRRIADALGHEEMPDGGPADLIEAVAEGVKFSNLDRILDTHINRLLVLRPRLSREEGADFLAGVFSYLGDPYDFRFDFADASRQVCTEVIYRALEGKAGIHFELVKRAGNPTLSADDIVLHYLGSRPATFDFVLFAEEDRDHADRRARIWQGAAGEERLREQMAPGGEEQGSPDAGRSEAEPRRGARWG